MEEVSIIVAHRERATLRVGDVFLKIDGDQARTDVEVEVMAMAPVPTPEILWRRPPVLALAAAPGDDARPPRRAVHRLAGGVGRGGGRRPDAARRAAAAVARPERRRAGIAPRRASASGSSPTTSFPPTWSPATAGSPRPRSGRGHRCSSTATCRSTTSSSTATRSPASSTGPRAPRATPSTTSPPSPSDTRSTSTTSIAGYGTDVDRDLIRAWWSLRCLTQRPLADRARLRLARGLPRGRRAEVPAVSQQMHDDQIPSDVEVLRALLREQQPDVGGAADRAGGIDRDGQRAVPDR